MRSRRESLVGAGEDGSDLPILETLGRDRVSATFVVRAGRGRRLIAREFLGLSTGMRQHLRFVFELQRGLKIEGLVAPEDLRASGDREIWFHRPVQGTSLSRAEFTPQAAVDLAARVTAMLDACHQRSVFGIELRGERLLVGRGGRPKLTGLVASPPVWDVGPGLDSMLFGQLDARIDLPALGAVFEMICDRTRPSGSRQGSVRRELERLSDRLGASAPDDRPTLEQVVEILRELGATCAVTPAARLIPIPRLAGRELLMREMEAVVERALRGGPELGRRPYLLAVAGRPGVGKTRAVTELAKRGSQRGFDVFAARSRRGDRRLLGPLEDILRLASVELPADDQAEALLAPAAERRRQIEVALASLVDALRDRPSLILIEDLDLLSEPALDALSYAVRELALEEPDPVRLFVVVTLRPGDAGADESAASRIVEDLREEGFAERVRLPLLDSDAVGEMMHSLGVDTTEAGSRIVARAGGVPRSVEEMVRLDREREQDGGTLPSGDIIRHRVRRSGAAEVQVMEALAILDRPASLALLASLVASKHRRELGAAVMRLLARRLLVPLDGPALDFHNRDAGAAIRRRLSAQRTKQLHRLAGRAIEKQPEVADDEVLARHFELGGVRDAFLSYGRRAAAALVDAHANDQALDLYTRLLEAVPKKDTAFRCELLERCAFLYPQVGDIDGAVDSYRELLELPHDRSRTWQYYKALGRAYRRRQDHVAAAESFDRGLASLGEAEDLAVADLLSEKAVMLARFGDLDTARGLADMAGALAERLDESRDVAEIRNRIGATYRILGDHERAVDHMEACLRISEKVAAYDLAGSALNNIGLYLSDHGQRERSLEYCLRSLEMSQKLGDVQSIAIRSTNVGALYLRNCDTESAGRYLETGLRIARRFGRSSVASNCLSNLAELNSQRGRYGDALDIRRRALKMNERLGRMQEYANQFIALIRDYLTLGAAEQSEQSVRQLNDIACRRDEPRLVALAQLGSGGVLALRGAYDEADQAFAEAEAVFRDIGAREELVSCLLSRAHLDLTCSRLGEARATAEEATTLATLSGLHADRAMSLLVLAEVALVDEDVEVAERHLREAEGIAGEIGQPELRWRGEFLAGEVALARGDETGAARRFTLAREILDEVVEHIGDADLAYSYMRESRRMRLLRRARETRGGGGK